MAVTKLTKSGFTYGSFNKYDDFLAGNSAYIPSSFESIATVTAAGGETSLSFTSIPSTYKHLQIRGIYRDTWTGGPQASNLQIQFNSDTGTNYTRHRLYGNGTSAAADGLGTQNFILLMSAGMSSGSSNTSVYGASIIDILDYASTSKNKTLKAISGGDFNTASVNYRIALDSGLWLSTSAISTVTLKPDDVAFAAGTTYALYGIRG